KRALGMEGVPSVRAEDRGVTGPAGRPGVTGRGQADLLPAWPVNTDMRFFYQLSPVPSGDLTRLRRRRDRGDPGAAHVRTGPGQAILNYIKKVEPEGRSKQGRGAAQPGRGVARRSGQVGVRALSPGGGYGRSARAASEQLAGAQGDLQLE